MSPVLISHLVGIALVAAAFLLLGRGVVRRNQGRSFNPWPAFILMLGALAYQLLVPEGGLISRFGQLALDWGLGMSLAALYLWAKQAKAVIFFVPGLLAVLVGAAVYGLDRAYDWIAQDLRQSEDAVQLLVELGPDDQLAEVEPILEVYDAVAEKAFPNVDLDESEDLAQYFLVYVKEGYAASLIADLNQDPENVDQVARNREVSLFEPVASDPQKNPPPRQFLADDPRLNQQWYAQALQFNAVYAMIKDRKPRKKAKVAIVDTGVDGVHEDISGVYTRSGGTGDQDKHSHGTHCAGLAGAATNNGKGVGSLNWNGQFVTLSGFPALDERGRGTDQRVAQAIIDAAESGADVISMSLGGPALFGPPKSQADAIAYARKRGAIVVVAAGNSNDDARRYAPANIKGVITVGAVDENLDKASFSNVNTKLKMPIAAPGVNILSSVPGSGYQSYNGTSMATPLVSGLIGMMRAFQPDLTTEQAYKILNATGTRVKDSGKVGRVINPKAALQAVMK